MSKTRVKIYNRRKKSRRNNRSRNKRTKARTYRGGVTGVCVDNGYGKECKEQIEDAIVNAFRADEDRITALANKAGISGIKLLTECNKMDVERYAILKHDYGEYFTTYMQECAKTHEKNITNLLNVIETEAKKLPNSDLIYKELLEYTNDAIANNFKSAMTNNTPQQTGPHTGKQPGKQTGKQTGKPWRGGDGGEMTKYNFDNLNKAGQTLYKAFRSNWLTKYINCNTKLPIGLAVQAIIGALFAVYGIATAPFKPKNLDITFEGITVIIGAPLYAILSIFGPIMCLDPDEHIKHVQSILDVNKPYSPIPRIDKTKGAINNILNPLDHVVEGREELLNSMPKEAPFWHPDPLGKKIAKYRRNRPFI